MNNGRDGMTMNENVIEFLKGQKTATVTACVATKLAGRVKRLAKERPEECEIVVENKDGSIVAHIPTKWIRINPSKIMTDEEREKRRQQAIERFSHKPKDNEGLKEFENEIEDELEEFDDDDLFD